MGRCGLDDSKPVNVTEYQGNDHLISTVLAPVLEGRAVRSLLVQPIFRNDNSGKVTAVILAVNKKDNGSETDIFFEDYFTEVGAEGGMGAWPDHDAVNGCYPSSCCTFLGGRCATPCVSLVQLTLRHCPAPSWMCAALQKR